jgi:CheY-like chemotaxis protein
MTKGTGLGLSTVYGVASAAGGGVCVSTSPQGSTFSLFLPVAAADSAQLTAPAARPAATNARRILVVDDNSDVRSVVARMLADAGHIVESGDAALALELEARGQRFDVLLTDMVMPHVSGVELAARLQSANPALPVVFMTGYVDPEVLDQLPSSAVVLRKPVTVAALVSAVAAVTGV